MSVRQSLLAILDQGPCYGYQLRAEFERRTGATWPLNVGQIYNTLDRLERDGLVAKDDVDPQGHVYWRITPAGSAEMRAWLDASVDRGRGPRDELAMKLAVAATLPGVDVARIIRAQRGASLARLRELGPRRDADATDPEDLARALVVDAMAGALEAELRWLERTEERLTRHPARTMALAPATERPRRGRPAKAPASATDAA